MCFDHDSRPPIRPIAGGALDSREVTLTAGDGNVFTAFGASAAEPTGASIVVLPDVRGLHTFYLELVLRFAENGIDAVGIDWFGRTAGLGRREDGFDHMPHVEQTTWDGVSADIAAGAAHARTLRANGSASLFTIGFCFGGRMSFLSPTLGLELAGAIGFYGPPAGPGRAGSPAPADEAGQIASPILGIFGGADAGIPQSAIGTFDRALEQAGVEHRLITYRDAPHSFFDRKAAEFKQESEQSWAEVLGFIRAHT